MTGYEHLYDDDERRRMEEMGPKRALYFAEAFHNKYLHNKMSEGGYVPLINSGKKSSLGPNIATEIRSGKPRDQASAIAYSVMRRAKKMAHGGYVEDVNYGPDATTESEFSDSNIRGHNEVDFGIDDDVLPDRFAMGGTVKNHPLDQMFRQKFLMPRMAYGGEVPLQDYEREGGENHINGEDYPTHEEEDRETNREASFEVGPIQRQASDEPKQDNDRRGFARAYLARKAVRKG